MSDQNPDVLPSAQTCFVIGPIGNAMAPDGSPERETYEEALRVLSEVVEPACKRVGLEPVRADNLARAGEITEQIFRRLRDDDVVIADLTGANANVMYELGLRHTRNKLTVQIGEYGRLPFDVNVIRTIQFSRSPIGLINARDQLVEVLTSGLVGDYDIVTATRLWSERSSTEIEQLSPRPVDVDIDLVEHTSADESGDQEGFLDILARGEERMDELEPALTRVNRHIVALGDLAESTTEEIAKSDAAGLGMRGRLQLATRHAAGLDAIADDLEADVAHYEGVLSAVSDAILLLIKDLEEDPELLKEPEAVGFAESTRLSASLSRDSMAALGGMVAAIRDNARLSRVLRAPSNRLTAALDRFGTATATMDEWDRRLQVLGVATAPVDWDAEDDRANDELSEQESTTETADDHRQDDDQSAQSSPATEATADPGVGEGGPYPVEDGDTETDVP